MSKLTATQNATLVWLDKIGGTCVAYRDKVCHPDDARPTSRAKDRQFRPRKNPMMPAVSALHLVQLGAIRSSGGSLHMTSYGRLLIASPGLARADEVAGDAEAASI
jgi:hypothetical protein